MRRAMIVVVMWMLCAGIVWAVPSFTPVIDGSKDALWGGTPTCPSYTQMQPTNFSLTGGCYVTNDLNFVYVGIPTDNDPWSDGNPINLSVLIDVGNTATGGTTDPYGASGVSYDMPFLPDYEIISEWAEWNQTIGYTNFCGWTGSGWSYNEIGSVGGSKGGGGGAFTEYAVPRSLIGSPADGSVINIAVWVRPANSKSCASSCIPEDNTFPGDWGDGCVGPFSTQCAYTMQVFAGDTMPHIVSATQLGRGLVEIGFNKPMNQTTLNQSGNYTPTGWTFIGIGLVTSNTVRLQSAGFADGGNYSVTLSSGITDTYGTPLTATNNPVSWTAPDYTDVRFTVTDQTLTHNAILLKGQWSNVNHGFDASWSNGATYPMYDDGTHGDVTPGDFIFSLTYYLLPDVHYEWGCVDDNGIWLPPSNQAFDCTVNDTTVNWVNTSPDYSFSRDVTVTFRCDMQFFADTTVDTVRIAGYMTGWSGKDMVDPDHDRVWTLDTLFRAGTSKRLEFKFQRIHNGTNWESISNRVIIADDNNATWTTDLMFFNDYFPAPEVTAYGDVTNGVVLRWGGSSTRVDYKVYGSSDIANIVSPANLLATIPGANAHEYNVGSAATIMYYRVVMVSAP
jgi:hypothetical protein